MKQELILKKFVPDNELMNLAEYIRNLKSIQIKGRFTYSGMMRTYGTNVLDNRRCVLGALMVEIWGAKDNCADIENVLRETKIFDEMAFRVKIDVWQGSPINMSFPFLEYRIQSLADRLVRMNDTGRTFDEMANWVELEAYNHGHWE